MFQLTGHQTDVTFLSFLILCGIFIQGVTFRWFSSPVIIYIPLVIKMSLWVYDNPTLNEIDPTFYIGTSSWH